MTSSNLLNLAKIGQLDLVPLSMELVKRMLMTARQRLRDAELVTAAALRECLEQARGLLVRVENTLEQRVDWGASGA